MLADRTAWPSQSPWPSPLHLANNGPYIITMADSYGDYGMRSYFLLIIRKGCWFEKDLDIKIQNAPTYLKLPHAFANFETS